MILSTHILLVTRFKSHRNLLTILAEIVKFFCPLASESDLDNLKRQCETIRKPFNVKFGSLCFRVFIAIHAHFIHT